MQEYPTQHDIRKQDIWESEKLFCPDYVWADYSINHCQRMLRLMTKHDSMDFIMDILNSITHSSSSSSDIMDGDDKNVILPLLEDESIRYQITLLLSNIITILKNDLPLRLHQFRCGIERDTSVTKRLYLIKNEYRAPFRAFLEGHDHVQRAPDLSLVNDYIALHDQRDGENNNGNSKATSKLKEKKKLAERKIQDYLNDTRLKEALMMEYKCEMLEIDMGNILFPFCNLARVLLDGKGAFHLQEVPGVLAEEDISVMYEVLRRLKSILCEKPEANKSTGILPLLQDIQGVPRDPSPSSMEISIFGQDSTHKDVSMEDAIDKRLDRLCLHLQCLHEMSKMSKAFGVDKKEFDNLVVATKRCAVALDTDIFCVKFKEWYKLCQSQRQLTSGKMDQKSNESESYSMKSNNQLTFDELAEEMRKAEIEVSIAMASRQALSVVQQRIDQIVQDRLKRFEILQEIVKEVCLREMDFHLDLKIPSKDFILELPRIETVSGIFEPALRLAGEN